MSRPRVVVYTTQYCPYCLAAKRLLQSKGVPFEEVDVSRDEAMREKLVQWTGRETVPQIFADDKPLGGYDDLVAYFSSGKSL